MTTELVSTSAASHPGDGFISDEQRGNLRTLGRYFIDITNGLYEVAPMTADPSLWDEAVSYTVQLMDWLELRGFLVPQVDPKEDPLRFGVEWGPFLVDIAPHVYAENQAEAEMCMAQIIGVKG